MEEVYNWFMENKEEIGVAVVAIHSAALTIVNLTPTPADDAFVAKLYKPVEWLAGILTKKAKQDGK